MIQDFILIFILASIPAAFSFLLDYALGFPGKEQINPKAIFFRYSFFLSIRRVMRGGKYNAIMEQFTYGGKAIDEEQEAIKLTIFIEGRKLFKWEQMVGMCAYCTNFWLSLIAAIIIQHFIHLQFINSSLFFLLIPIYSHLILRKI